MLVGWLWAIELTSLFLSSNVKKGSEGRGEGITIIYKSKVFQGLNEIMKHEHA